MNEPLRTALERLFSANLTDAALEDHLTALANTQPEAFRALADVWAIRLYERSPYIFGDFIAAHLTAGQRNVVESLLRRAEADSQTALFKQLYPLVANRDRWNADALALAQNAPDYETLVTGLELRSGDWALIDENVLLALYERNPTSFKDKLRGEILYHYRGGVFRRLPSDNQLIQALRQAIAKREPGSDFYYEMFRRYATRDEWQAAVRQLIAQHPAKIDQALDKIQHEHQGMFLDANLEEELFKAFGEVVMPYLPRHSRKRLEGRIREAIQTELDNEQLLQHLVSLRNENWQRFQQTTCVWAIPLYDRNPNFFGTFIVQHANAAARCILGLMQRAKSDGHYDFFRKLAASLSDNTAWNNDLLGVIRADLSDSNLLRELDRLDLQQEHKSAWNVRQRIYLIDETATALFKRRTAVSVDFIWRYLPSLYIEQQSKRTAAYPALIEAARTSGDEELYLRLLRRVGTADEWEAEMRRLLARDIPPEQILAELEKRKPSHPDRTNPAILYAFLEKYGAAVLSFFENYLDWTNPARLTALLDLDIDRAELQRELQRIARRQPQEFAERADVWAVRLYERSPEFFGPFIIRNLGWRQSQEAVKELLQRAEADGKEQVFRDLYTSVFTGDAWTKDVARSLRAGLSDEELHAALDRRITPWTVLPDDLATTLYKRSPELFRPFIMEHLGNRFNRVQYKQLRIVAEVRGDGQLVEALREIADPETVRAQRMEAVQAQVSQGVPFAEIESQLRELSKQEDYLTKRIRKLIVGLVDRYGDEAMPFVLDFIRAHRWRLGDEHADWLKAAEPRISPANFWQLAFLLNQRDRWHSALDNLSREEISEAEFRDRLAILTPETQFGSVPNKTALALYRRHPEAARPFLERFLDDTPMPELLELVEQAEHNHDDTLLDVLTYKMLIRLNHDRMGDFIPYRGGKRPLSDHKSQLLEIGKRLIDRLDRLYGQSPETFVQHAAYVLNFLRPFDLGWRDRGRPAEDNALWAHLTGQHRDTWRASPQGITALLESPSIYVQLVALEILNPNPPLSPAGEESGVRAEDMLAARILENLRSFRAILLSKMHKDTKCQALACLEAAARANADAATRILPLLQETLDFQARRAIATDIAQALVRLTYTNSIEHNG